MLPNDHEVARNILIKQFDCFTDRGFGFKSDKFADNLFQLDGDDWRVVRQRLSPIFTSVKLKNMFPLMAKSADSFAEHVEKIIDTQDDHEIRDLTSMYTLDSIGSCAFGVDVDAFCEEDNIYRTIAYTLMDLKFSILLKIAVDRFCPILLPLFKIIEKDHLFEFFFKLVRQGLKEREGKPKIRHDLMDFLVQMKEDGGISGDKMKVNKEHNIGVDEVFMASQVFAFYSAGFEPAAATMSFLLYELAMHPEVQEKVRMEVDEVISRHNNSITYEAISEMSYLEMVLSETLRKYPAADVIFRQCVRECELPEQNLKIDIGTYILISLKRLHNDPEYFPSPEKFDPERFSPKNKHKIPTGAYMPFGEGPRMCIGYRYAKLLSMLGVATIMKSFTISKTEKTKEKLIFECRSFLILSLISKNGLWVRFDRRQKLR